MSTPPKAHGLDGTLVEKPVGYFESRLAGLVLYFIETFLAKHDLGTTYAESAPFRAPKGKPVSRPQRCLI